MRTCKKDKIAAVTKFNHIWAPVPFLLEVKREKSAMIEEYKPDKRELYVWEKLSLTAITDGMTVFCIASAMQTRNM